MNMNRNTTHAALAVISILLTWTAALADPLPPGATQTKPGVGLTSPNYTSGVPSYFVPGRLVNTFTAPTTVDFVGSVTTDIYLNPAGGYTFAYRFANTGSPPTNPELVRATLGPTNWGGVTILGAGADTSGQSTPAGTAPRWSTGDPYLIGRADVASGSYPFFQWQQGNSGTTIDPGNQRSALIWLETDVPTFSFGNIALSDGGQIGRAQVLVVPAPGAAVLALMGLGMVAWLRRTTRRRIYA